MTRHTCFRASLLFCALSLICSTQSALAQVTTGRIAGVVTDSSGSTLPDVAVTVTQVDTSTSTTVNTDAAGEYVATNLKIGTYTVSFQKQGFQRSVQSNVDVGIGQVVRVDVALKVGVVTQTVEVTGAPPLLQTETSALGTIETEKRIVDLPLNGRNFFKLAFLGPGRTREPREPARERDPPTITGRGLPCRSTAFGYSTITSFSTDWTITNSAMAPW